MWWRHRKVAPLQCPTVPRPLLPGTKFNDFHFIHLLLCSVYFYLLDFFMFCMKHWNTGSMQPTVKHCCYYFVVLFRCLVWNLVRSTSTEFVLRTLPVFLIQLSNLDLCLLMTHMVSSKQWNRQSNSSSSSETVNQILNLNCQGARSALFKMSP